MLTLFRKIAKKIAKNTPLKIIYILMTTLALIFWLMQGSISAYWSLTYHRPSPLEPLSRFEWWQKGEVLHAYINTLSNNVSDNHDQDDDEPTNNVSDYQDQDEPTNNVSDNQDQDDEPTNDVSDNQNQDDEPTNMEIIEPAIKTQAKIQEKTAKSTLTCRVLFKHLGVSNDIFSRHTLNFKSISSPVNPHRHHPITRRMRSLNGTDKAQHGTLITNHDGYKTKYAHLSLIMPNARSGKRVRKLQIIARIGNTELSTGTSLYYELFANGLASNSMTVSLPNRSSKEKNNTATKKTILSVKATAKTQISTNIPTMNNRGLQLFTPKNDADVALKSSTSDIKEKIIKSKSPQSVSPESIKLPESNKKVTQNTKKVTTIMQKKPLKGKSPNKQKPTIASSEKTKITHHLTRDVTRNIKSKKTVNMGSKSGITLYSNDKVFFVGDSLMQGIAPHIKYQLSKKHSIKSINKSKQSTGLSYHKFLNWPKTVNQTLKANKTIRLMIVFLGPNDPWSMPGGKGGKFLKFKTKKWENVYRGRIKTIIKMSKKHHVQILWLGVPNMRRKKLNRGVDYLNTLYRSEAKKAGIIYVPTNPLFGYKGKAYSKFGPNLKGRTVSLRTKDGIHFTASGQKRIANYVLSLIKIKSGKRP